MLTIDSLRCADTLPADLNLRLRVNRQDPALADSHGQVWLQVVAAASQDPELLRGRAVEVERRVVDILQLGSTPRFPTPRLVSIWRNERWRQVTTRWCETSLGRTTFQISTWDWMIRYRTDDVRSLRLPPRASSPSSLSWGVLYTSGDRR